MDTSNNSAEETTVSFLNFEYILFKRFLSSFLLSLRASFLFFLLVCFFLVCCLYQYKQTQSNVVSSFERERIIETNNHEASDETTDEFLFKVEGEKQRRNYEIENAKDSYNFFGLLYWHESIGVYLSFWGWYIAIPKPSEIAIVGECSPFIQEFIQKADDYITSVRFSLY